MAKYRKAVAAFITPLVGLPIAGWIIGDAAFDWGTVASAFIAGLTAAAVYIFPNDKPAA
jgi:hypothetical protein